VTRVNRSPELRVIAVALIVFGVWRALYLPAMLAGASTPLLFAGFLLQAVCGIAAGVLVWRGAARAPLLILLTGASVALTELFGIALGIAAWLYALLAAVFALAIACALAWFVARLRGESPA
jgi:hypothetical protein